jgi:hypothetical protein
MMMKKENLYNIATQWVCRLKTNEWNITKHWSNEIIRITCAVLGMNCAGKCTLVHGRGAGMTPGDDARLDDCTTMSKLNNAPHNEINLLSIKRNGGKGGGVCVCICLCVSKCRCAHAAIGRPFSTCEKGRKHPRLRLTSLDSTKIDQKGRHHPRLQSYRGAEGNRTHTHTSDNVGEGWGRIFPLAISMSSIKFLDECWVWNMTPNTRRGWVRGKHSPIE